MTGLPDRTVPTRMTRGQCPSSTTTTTLVTLSYTISSAWVFAYQLPKQLPPVVKPLEESARVKYAVVSDGRGTLRSPVILIVL